MFIDTEAANRGTKVPAINSPDNTGYSSQETTPLMTSFLGQAPPPSYLEATTPNLWNASRSGDEGARLLSFDGRASPAPPLADPLDGLYKGPTYRKRTLRELCSRARAMKWIAAILAIAVVAAIIAAVTHKNRAVSTVISILNTNNLESNPHETNIFKADTHSTSHPSSTSTTRPIPTTLAIPKGLPHPLALTLRKRLQCKNRGIRFRLPVIPPHL